MSSKIDDKMTRQIRNEERQKQLNLQLLAMKNDDTKSLDDEFGRKRTLAASRKAQEEPDMDGSVDDESMIATSSDEENEAYASFLASKNVEKFIPPMAIALSSLKNKKQIGMQ